MAFIRLMEVPKQPFMANFLQRTLHQPYNEGHTFHEVYFSYIYLRYFRKFDVWKKKIACSTTKKKSSKNKIAFVPPEKSSVI